jgi:hypothetical protein
MRADKDREMGLIIPTALPCKRLTERADKRATIATSDIHDTTTRA